MSEVGKYKKLIDKLPFLMPRNVFTDKIPDDFDYSYHCGSCLPKGWEKLFLQMCKDIKVVLIAENYLDEFRFVQVKEKYGKMCCYTNGVSEEVQMIISKYENLSRYVCSQCGKPAHYLTTDYIIPICESCWKDYFRDSNVEEIEFRDCYCVVRWFSNTLEEYQEIISIKYEWDRYVKSLE